MRIRDRLFLLLLCGCVVGCSDLTQPDPPPPDPPALLPEVTVHGVIDLTEPGPVGPQGVQPPHFLHTDDGRLLGLVLSPQFAVLGEPESDVRGVTVTGRLEPIIVEPIGGGWEGIVVSSFQFDSP